MKYLITLLCCVLFINGLFGQTAPDSDKDGIPDSEDVCPFTAGTKANKGCPEESKVKTSPAKVALQPVPTRGYQQELDQLNKYLETFAGGSYGIFRLENDSVYNRLKGGEYWYRFSVKDISGAEVDADNKCVAIMCADAKVHCIMPSYGSNDGGDRLMAYLNNGRRPFNYAILANLMNRFLFALKKQPVPASLIYDENIYTKTTTPEEDAIAEAKTPLEKAAAELAQFLKSLPYGNDYFSGAELNGSVLRINMLRADNININLDRVGAVRISNVGVYRPEVNIVSGASGYCISNNSGSYYEKQNYNQLDSGSAKKFYLLLGNLLEAYRSQKDSKYKPGKSYAEKLAVINDPGFLEKIDEGSTVRIGEVPGNEKDYRKLNKWKGAEVTVFSPLTVNEDLETYSGTIRTGNGTNYAVKNLKIVFIKDKDGNNAIASRNIYADALNDKAKKELDAETELQTQWYPVTKLIKQFVEDGKTPGGFLKYKSESVYTLNGDESVTYFLDKYKVAKHMVSVYLDMPKDRQMNRIVIRFNASYRQHYLDYINYQVPVKPSRNPENLEIQEDPREEGEAGRILALFANKQLVFKVVEIDDKNTGGGRIVIYERKK